MKVKVYCPKKPEYQGEDAATILKIKDTYLPIYLDAGVGGLAQLVESKKKYVILFNRINPNFFNEFVCKLAEDFEKRGKVALEEWGITE